MTADAEVIVTRGDLTEITLNRPRALHALNTGMCAIMSEVLANAGGAKAVLMRHAPGTRGFCAGGDIRMLAESGAGDGAEAYAFFATEYRLNTRIKELAIPYIAIMDGVTMGGGVGISVHGRYRIATGNTVFAMPETGIGLFPDVGGSWFLPRLEGELGTWLALTGARLKGRDVFAAGVATHFISSEGVDALVEALRARPDAAEAVLAAHCELKPGDRVEASFDPHRATMDAGFRHDSAEATFAALEAAPDPWAHAQLETLKTKSPQTLKVALRQCREGLRLTDFRDVMRMEYRIARRVVHRHDFQEGVRAVIIDKDNAPAWSPARIEDVPDSLIDAIFDPLGADELTFDF